MLQNKDKGSHYRFEYKGIKLDPARIGMIYGVSNPLQMAIVKKGLVAGKRGKKSLREDLEDIITACERWIEIINEDLDEDTRIHNERIRESINQTANAEEVPLNFPNR